VNIISDETPSHQFIPSKSASFAQIPMIHPPLDSPAHRVDAENDKKNAHFLEEPRTTDRLFPEICLEVGEKVKIFQFFENHKIDHNSQHTSYTYLTYLVSFL
jgi:hypothetical protein